MKIPVHAFLSSLLVGCTAPSTAPSSRYDPVCSIVIATASPVTKCCDRDGYDADLGGGDTIFASQRHGNPAVPWTTLQPQPGSYDKLMDFLDLKSIDLRRADGLHEVHVLIVTH